jgi:hypothetical protein
MDTTTTGGNTGKAEGTVSGGRRKRWVTYGILAAAGATALAALGARRPVSPRAIDFDGDLGGPVVRMPPATTKPAELPAVAAAEKRPQVEVVFALDTTSSMSGLIEGAKRKIWSIASFIAQGQPTPELKVGLVGYRDIGDAYVTKVFDLDDDLDRVYRHLRQFRAEGGGDTPEHVARGLDDAVHKMSWSPAGNQEVLRLIYLVGDAPAHTDYDDGYSLVKATRAAAAKGIQVHAIRCGDDVQTAEQWRRVASLGKGQFLSIGQDGGMRDDRTPFDEELGRLHDEVSGTVVTYGAKGAEAAAALREAAAAPAPVKAARAGFLAKRHAGVGGEGDLVEGVASGRVDMDKMAPKDMPESLRALAPAEQKAKIAKLADDRKKTQARIEELVVKRDAYLASAKAEEARGMGAASTAEPTAGPRHLARAAAPAAATPPPASFDAEVAKTVVSGAKKIGVSYAR